MATIKEFEHLTIPLTSVQSATNDFSDSNRIGNGGFGKVYLGELFHSDQRTVVAVKRLDRRFGQGDPEFWKEIMMLSLYKHENIVSLLGFCNENSEKIIVYEYASNKSLDLYLNRSDLTWIQRLHICIGAARGLEYLHDPKGTQQRILHRDIKSSNILLDDNWKAKISDFGLAKFGPASQPYTFLVSHTVGTFGYCDPLYVETGFLTKESDVYSFGVVLFEVLCGRLCYDKHSTEAGSSFARLVRKYYKQNSINEIVYKDIQGQIKPNSLKVFVEIAYKCLKKEPKERPTMTQIVKELENALEAQLVAISDFGKMLHGCKHYRRRCKIRAPCCNQIFPCRHCHNEHTIALDDPNERHRMVPKDVKKVVCTICNTEQPVGQICSGCGVKMGEYYCGICHLYDDDTSKQQFHCDDCGICRLYGRENYFHCHTCGGCYSGSHTCLENAMKSDCGVCDEYLFDSIKKITVMSCGHPLHTDCYPEIISSNQCPICSKT